MYKDLVYRLSDEEFIKLLKESNNLTEFSIKLGFSGKPGKSSKDRIRKRIASLDPDLPLFTKQIGEESKKNIIKSNKSRRKFIEKYCVSCGKKLVHDNKTGYCKDCLTKKQQSEKLSNWLLTGKTGNTCVGNTIRGCIRDYIYSDQDNKCSICGMGRVWNNKKINFILDHIDGDASNDSRDNLRLICPNCDSQLDTYMSKNKNSARVKRYRGI